MKAIILFEQFNENDIPFVQETVTKLLWHFKNKGFKPCSVEIHNDIMRFTSVGDGQVAEKERADELPQEKIKVDSRAGHRVTFGRKTAALIEQCPTCTNAREPGTTRKLWQEASNFSQSQLALAEKVVCCHCSKKNKTESHRNRKRFHPIVRESAAS